MTNWNELTRRDFDTAAPDQPLTLFAAPDECGSFATLFDLDDEGAPQA